jgi:hypothetical protein
MLLNLLSQISWQFQPVDAPFAEKVFPDLTMLI